MWCNILWGGQDGFSKDVTFSEDLNDTVELAGEVDCEEQWEQQA